MIYWKYYLKENICQKYHILHIVYSSIQLYRFVTVLDTKINRNLNVFGNVVFRFLSLYFPKQMKKMTKHKMTKKSPNMAHFTNGTHNSTHRAKFCIWRNFFLAILEKNWLIKKSLSGTVNVDNAAPAKGGVTSKKCIAA